MFEYEDSDHSLNKRSLYRIGLGGRRERNGLHVLTTQHRLMCLSYDSRAETTRACFPCLIRTYNTKPMVKSSSKAKLFASANLSMARK